MTETTWVVVANSSKAKIYRVEHFPKIVEIQYWDHPESRLQNQDIVSSQPGRTFQRGGVTRHSYETSDPKELEMEIFAKTLAGHLTTEFQNGNFSRFYLMANPSFLGMLRKHFDHKTQSVIIKEIPKDFTTQNQTEIEQHLFNL